MGAVARVGAHPLVAAGIVAVVLSLPQLGAKLLTERCPLALAAYVFVLTAATLFAFVVAAGAYLRVVSAPACRPAPNSARPSSPSTWTHGQYGSDSASGQRPQWTDRPAAAASAATACTSMVLPIPASPKIRQVRTMPGPDVVQQARDQAPLARSADQAGMTTGHARHPPLSSPSQQGIGHGARRAAGGRHRTCWLRSAHGHG